MFPTLYQISGNLGIHTYGLMIMLGLLGAFVYSSNRARKIGIESDDLPIMYLLVAVAGVLGARLFYFIFSATEAFFANPFIFFTDGGGLVFYGGAIGGVVTGVAFCYWKKISALKMADIGAPAIMFGLGSGRVGCFLAGCCHGRPVQLFVDTLRPSVRNEHVQSWLRRTQTADDVFLAIAQNPEASKNVYAAIQADPTQQAIFSQLAERVQISLSQEPSQIFRSLSEGLRSAYASGGYPSKEVQQLSSSIMSQAGDDGWTTILSQADLLSTLPHELRHAATESILSSHITGSLLPGGEVVLVDGAPNLSLMFTKGVGVGSLHDIPLYPTQVWESLGAFSLFLALAWMWIRVRKFDGQIMATMMIMYAGMRSSIETFRGDKIRGEDWFGLLSTSQLISVVMVVLAILLIVILAPRGLAPETPLPPKRYDEDDLFDDVD